MVGSGWCIDLTDALEKGSAMSSCASEAGASFSATLLSNEFNIVSLFSSLKCVQLQT